MLDPFDRHRRITKTSSAERIGAVIYRRVSEPSQRGAKRRGEERSSLPDQLADCERCAKEHNRKLVEDYDYIETEQGDIWARPILQRLVRDMRQRKFDTVIIQHPDRFSRSKEVKARFRLAASDYGVEVLYANVAVDDTPTGKAAEAAFDLVAELEKDRIRDRTQPRRRARATSGTKIIAGGYPKYGYTWVLDARQRIETYEVDPETAPVVQEVVSRMAAGETIKSIAVDLTRRGVPTPGQILIQRGLMTGKAASAVRGRWTRHQIVRIIFSPEYAGVHMNYHAVADWEEYTDPKTGLARRRRNYLLRRDTTSYLPLDQLREEYGDYLMPVPQIVDPTVHLMAQKRLLGQSTGPRGGPRDDNLLSGHIYCGHCGSRMSVRRNKKYPDYSGYFCPRTPQHAWHQSVSCSVPSNQITIRHIDRAVWDQIFWGLRNPSVITNLLNNAVLAVQQGADQAESERLAVERELQSKRAELQALALQAADPKLHPVARDALTEKLNTVASQIETLEKIERDNARWRANQGAFIERIEELAEWMRHLNIAGCTGITWALQREVLFVLGVKVYVWRGRNPENATKRNGLRYTIQADWSGMDLQERMGAGSLAGYAKDHAGRFPWVVMPDIQFLLSTPSTQMTGEDVALWNQWREECWPTCPTGKAAMSMQEWLQRGDTREIRPS